MPILNRGGKGVGGGLPINDRRRPQDQFANARHQRDALLDVFDRPASHLAGNPAGPAKYQETEPDPTQVSQRQKVQSPFAYDVQLSESNTQIPRQEQAHESVTLP